MGIKLIVNAGDKYGDWTIIREEQPRKRADTGGSIRMVACICSCGKIAERTLSSLNNKTKPSKSCGCNIRVVRHPLTEAQKLARRLAQTTHGMSKTKTYSSWIAMKTRCYKSSHMHFANYGGRGIEVCSRWLHSFDNFYADMGERPEGKSIDRIDGSKGYSPENCRWATYKTQSRNRDSFNNRIKYNGEDMTISEWSERTGIKYTTIIARQKRGLHPEQILNKKLNKAKTYAYKGYDLNVLQWAKKTNIGFSTLQARLARGWSISEALGGSL